MLLKRKITFTARLIRRPVPAATRLKPQHIFFTLPRNLFSEPRLLIRDESFVVLALHVTDNYIIASLGTSNSTTKLYALLMALSSYKNYNYKQPLVQYGFSSNTIRGGKLLNIWGEKLPSAENVKYTRVNASGYSRILCGSWQHQLSKDWVTMCLVPKELCNISNEQGGGGGGGVHKRPRACNLIFFSALLLRKTGFLNTL